MKYYAVIDTNVIVSAMIKSGSVPGSILKYALRGLLVPVLNEEIVEEYRTVLMRPKFHLTKEIVNSILSRLEETGIYVDAESLEIELPDPKDLVFYEVAMKGRKSQETYLVTGNLKHFPKEHYIVSPREMLDIIQNDA